MPDGNFYDFRFGLDQLDHSYTITDLGFLDQRGRRVKMNGNGICASIVYEALRDFAMDLKKSGKIKWVYLSDIPVGNFVPDNVDA